MNILEKTKKIADFIKLDYTPTARPEYYVRQIKPNGRLGKLKDWNPSEDWNVIMDVMKYIRNLDGKEDLLYYTVMTPFSVSIFNANHKDPITYVCIDESTDDSLLIAAFDSIILFIDWYENNKKINDETI